MIRLRISLPLRAACLLAFSSASVPVSTHAQAISATTVSGSVDGHVTCNDGGVPARAASVHLVPLASLLPKEDNNKTPASEALESSTDFDGYYVFPSVPPGRYIVDVQKDGYGNDLKLVRTVLDHFTQEQQTKLLASFPQVAVGSRNAVRADVVLRRAGAISGRVTVDSGGTVGPTPVTVTLISSSLIGDASSQQGQNGGGFSLRGLTDDRGDYRVAGLPKGKYRIEVRLSEAYFRAVNVPHSGFTLSPTRTGVADRTVYAPEALTETDARLVEIGDGDELTDVDITIPMRLLHSVGGTVTSGGAPLAGASLSVQRQGQKVQAYGAISTSEGAYRFDLLPAGSYTIEAKYTDPATHPDRPATGRLVVLLGGNDIVDANLDLPIQPPAK